MQVYNKAIVAAVMGLIGLANVFLGWNFGFTEDQVTAVVTIFTPILVYLIPNKTA